jgi:hypothetical protein
MAAGAMGGVILTLFGAVRLTLGVRGISTTVTSGLVSERDILRACARNVRSIVWSSDHARSTLARSARPLSILAWRSLDARSIYAENYNHISLFSIFVDTLQKLINLYQLFVLTKNLFSFIFSFSCVLALANSNI